jgi:hypothetical protein
MKIRCIIKGHNWILQRNPDLIKYLKIDLYQCKRCKKLKEDRDN